MIYNIVAIVIGVLITTVGAGMFSQQANAAAVNTFFDESTGGTIIKHQSSSQTSFQNSNAENFHNHSVNTKP